MTAIQPELWVDRADEAVAFYEAAFGAAVLHRVGEEDDIVVQLAVGDAAFWVAAASPSMKRFSPRAIGGATSRTLLVVTDLTPALLHAHVGADGWARSGMLPRGSRAVYARRTRHEPEGSVHRLRDACALERHG